MPQVTGYLTPKYASDDYGTHLDFYSVGGYRGVATFNDLALIPVKKRRRMMMVGVSTYGGKPAMFILNSPDNTSTNLANNDYWEELLLGANVAGGLTYSGNFDPTTGIIEGTSTVIADDPLAPSTALAGHFYIATTGGTFDPGTGNIVFNQGDWIVYDTTRWRILRQNFGLNWNTLPEVPTILRQIGDGSIAVATTTDIQDLQDQINAISIPNVVEVISELTTGVPSVQAVIDYIYSKTQIDTIIDDTLLTEYIWVATEGQTDFVLPSGNATITNIIQLLLDTVPAWEVGVDYDIITTNFSNDTIRFLSADPIPAGAKVFLKYFSNVSEIAIETSKKTTYSWANNESGSVAVGKTSTDDVVTLTGKIRTVDKTLVTRIDLTIKVAGGVATLSGFVMSDYVSEFENIFTGASINGTDIQLDYNVGSLGQDIVLTVKTETY